jgi:hypothetical protein
MVRHARVPRAESCAAIRARWVRRDFVEVYGREEEAPPPIEIEVPEGMGQGEAIQVLHPCPARMRCAGVIVRRVGEAHVCVLLRAQELSKELNAAVARGDGRVAAAIKNKIQELGRPRE